MYFHRHFSSFIVFIALTAMLSCTKENYEELQIEQEFAEPEIVYLMDCPTLGQNIGDTCSVEFEQFGSIMGLVTDDCVCDAEPVGEQITIVFNSDLPWITTVSVTSSPPFLAGQSAPQVGSNGLNMHHYLLPEGTTECTFTVSYICPGGVVYFPDIIITGSPINGAVGPLEIEC